MASGEVYTGLQQGTIDAAENAICAYYSSAYYEVCKELSLTEHFYGATALLMSKKVFASSSFAKPFSLYKKVFASLTEEQQTILKEAAAEARDLQRADVAERETRYLDELQAEDGVTVHEDVDKDAFRAITDEIYPKFYDTIPQDLIESIRNCAY
jgi:TRAP-type C4-dicarboxylate transport system substrate-binding protein